MAEFDELLADIARSWLGTYSTRRWAVDKAVYIGYTHTTIVATIGRVVPIDAIVVSGLSASGQSAATGFNSWQLDDAHETEKMIQYYSREKLLIQSGITFF